MLRGITPAFCLLLACCLGGVELSGIPIDVSWNGGSGDWTEADNWDPAVIPNETGQDEYRVTTSGSGTITIGEGVFIAITRLTHSTADIAGAGELKVTGTYDWNSGDRLGNGRTLIDSTAVMNIKGTSDRKFGDGHTLENNGSIETTSSSRDIFAGEDMIVNNSGTITISSNLGFLSDSSSNPAVLNNDGLFIKAGASTTTTEWDAIFNNRGTTRVEKGDLELQLGGTHTGAFEVEDPGVLIFSGGTHVFNAGAKIDCTGCDGEIMFSGGDFVVNTDLTNVGTFTYDRSGSYALDSDDESIPTFTNEGTFSKISTGTATINLFYMNEEEGILHVDTGDIELAGSGSFAGSVEIDNLSTLNFMTGDFDWLDGLDIMGSGLAEINDVMVSVSGTATVENLSLEDGTLELDGDSDGILEVGGSFAWNDGDIDGGGLLRVAGGASMTLPGASAKLLRSGTGVENNGTLTVTGSGSLRSGPGSLFRNNGSFNINTAFTLEGDAFGSETMRADFENAGMLTKSAGAAAVTLDVNMTNTGTGQMILTGGAFTLADNFQNDGILELQDSELTVHRGATLTSSGTIQGTGTINADIGSSGVLEPGLSAGTLNVNGDASFDTAAQSRFELGGTTQGTEYDFLDISGTATLGGTLEIAIINDFVPESDTVFDIIQAGAISGTFEQEILPMDSGNGEVYTVVYGETTVSVMVQLLGTYAVWVTQNFEESEQEDPLISGPEADPDGDGIPNLLEYVFDLLPKEYDHVPPVTQGVISENDQSFISLTFPYREGITDVTFDVEQSSNLVDWNSALFTQSGETTVTLKIEVPIESEVSQFFRLVAVLDTGM